MNDLRLTSCQAHNTIPVSREIAAYLSQRLGSPVKFVDDIPWPERYRLLDKGQIHAAWICGLPYVRRFDQPNTTTRLWSRYVVNGVFDETNKLHDDAADNN
jgi:ABC-type phosphate/phosphonate transport system substrate-binding protein